MTQTVSAREIRKAGGLETWMKKAAQAPQAKGRIPADALVGYDVDRMNKLEARYAGYLEGQRREGLIVFWRYEAVKFRLADRTWYTPDFYIMRTDGSIEIHETKGWMEDDANVKIKATADIFPEFWFVLVKWERGDWRYKRYRAVNE
ncbi:MAG: hypothetical protein LBC79_02175 [Deltaproteobacteria bacterium]|jgi:hypothetical protein|nr:hypothetical protein [Deltaproteobacteria bacterium]